jgi:2-(1,2-epoxy-1,2-dihydrophenyl)acetyl-CoA isomerase
MGSRIALRFPFGPKLALIPDVGATWFLSHLVGRARARGLALTGETLSATDAESWGLVWRCIDDESLMPESLALAERLAVGPTNADSDTDSDLDSGGND